MTIAGAAMHRVRNVLLASLFIAIAHIAEAQYFGTNKVQYEKFDFKVLKTEHFDIYYYPEEAGAVQLAARMSERWYSRLSQLLDHQLSSRQPIILYAAHPHFQQTNALPGEIGEGTGGVTEMLKRRVVLPFAGGLAETDHVLGHELVHAFQFDIATSNEQQDRPGPAVLQLPLWFIEGMAEYLSLGPIDSNTAMWVRDATARDKMPTVAKLDDPEFFPYRYGHAFWAYVAGRWGDAAVGDMLRVAGARGDIDAALQQVLGIDRKTFDRDWHDATRRTYAPWFEVTRPATAFGRSVITSQTSGGELNVAPALSPDGKQVVFLSERSLFSIDMYVANTDTGKVTRKLVETAGNPHFDSLEFIESAGDWAPDNRRFVFAGLSRGQPLLAIVDTTTGSHEREQVFPDIDEIFNPAWSPDGGRIAFSALKGGVLDLFVFDLASGTLTQLTNDPFADYDPEWSPDGRAIAWVTDQFSSNLQTLDFGNYRIGLLDVATRTARPLAGFDTGRNTNPEFSADGRSLFFIAAPDGIPNVYRTSLTAGSEPVRLTNVTSGVSGITPQTPALSVAAAAPAYVFTVFEDNHYNIYAEQTGRQAVDAAPVDRNAAVLPPYSRPAGDVARLLQTPTAGLPPPASYPTTPYKPSLSIDQIGRPTFGVGADRFGAYGGGAIALSWSDMLGHHELGTTFEASSRLQEFGGAVGYINRKSRWNWGVVGEVTPYVIGGFAQGLATVGGVPVIVQQSQRIIQRDTAVTGLLQYPFSRAQRVEFAAGMRRIGFDQELETELFSASTGELLQREKQDLPRPDPLSFAETSAALVYDTSVFGATSPLIGQRYRLEFTQMTGSLTYSGVLADYRRYWMPVRPLTFAVRGLHYGRYGSGAEDVRLSPLFLGYPGLVRGYEIESFDAAECASASTTSCPSFDRLIGSRMAVAGFELRAPLFGLFSRRTLYGPVPIEIGVFGDAGTAWTRDIKPQLLGGDREWARSVGGLLRINLFGYAIGEIDYVKPFDRTNRGWQWQFNLTPGF
jgi:Tol biopolymer transport system component